MIHYPRNDERPQISLSYKTQKKNTDLILIYYLQTYTNVSHIRNIIYMYLIVTHLKQIKTFYL